MLPSDTRKASRPCPSMISTGDCIEEHDHQRYWDAEKRAPSSVKVDALDLQPAGRVCKLGSIRSSIGVPPQDVWPWIA
jgi:hypothetical protein